MKCYDLTFFDRNTEIIFNTPITEIFMDRLQCQAVSVRGDMQNQHTSWQESSGITDVKSLT